MESAPCRPAGDRLLIEGKGGVHHIWACDHYKTTLNALRFKQTYKKRTDMVKDAMSSVPYGDRAAMVNAIMEAIRKGGLFAVDVDIVPTQIGQACHVWLPAATSGDEDAFYNKNAGGGEHVTYERLRAMGTNGFQEPAVEFKDGKIIGTKRLYTDGKFGAGDGKAHFMATQWRGLEAPGKEQQKAKFKYLINNGRTNHVWQNAYLDQQNDFVMDRWPYPFIDMNPEDMTELGEKEGDLVESLQ